MIALRGMNTFALEHRFVNLGSIQLHVVQFGPPKGRPVMLLHGFPDFWIGWKRQLGALASAGYRVIIPDQRGYNSSDKPRAIGEYALGKLVGDVVGLADALGLERFYLVGHDWGGIVAWATAAIVPHRLDKLVILNAPHPSVLLPYSLQSPTQVLRSSYAAFFQIPLLPEAVLSAHRSALLVRALKGSSRQGAFDDEDVAAYRQAWEQPEALTSMLNWYRALRFGPSLPQRVTTPTLVIWGVQDQALEFGLAQRSLDLCDHGQLRVVEKATHWVHREESGVVNAALRGFFNG